MGIAQYDPAALGRPAWNAGRTVGVKRPLKQRQIWAIRFFLDREGRMCGAAINLGTASIWMGASPGASRMEGVARPEGRSWRRREPA
jgi:hypothetical protein